MRHLLNRTRILLLLLFLTLILSGCTATAADTDENGLIPHLTVDLQLPAKLQMNKAVTLSLTVQRSSQPFEEAEEAAFTIWREDTPEETITLPAIQRLPGVYEADHTFASEGLYVIQSHVLATDMEVMPSKRLAIGSEALEQLAQLEQQQGDNPTAPVIESHH